MIKAVIFDVGGVIVDDAFPGMAKYYAKSLDVSVEEFLNAHNPESDKWLKGELTEEEYWKIICSKLNRPLPNVDSLWAAGLEASFHPKPKMMQLIQSLKSKGLKIAILSNTEKPNSEFMRKIFLDLDQLLFSCDLDCEKPEREIFEIALKRLEISASEAIFIDDIPQNVLGAEKVGIKSILFEFEEQLQEELNSLNLI